MPIIPGPSYHEKVAWLEQALHDFHTSQQLKDDYRALFTAIPSAFYPGESVRMSDALRAMQRAGIPGNYTDDIDQAVRSEEYWIECGGPF